jgi:hypothetical protein
MATKKVGDVTNNHKEAEISSTTQSREVTARHFHIGGSQMSNSVAATIVNTNKAVDICIYHNVLARKDVRHN